MTGLLKNTVNSQSPLGKIAEIFAETNSERNAASTILAEIPEETRFPKKKKDFREGMHEQK